MFLILQAAVYIAVGTAMKLAAEELQKAAKK